MRVSRLPYLVSISSYLCLIRSFWDVPSQVRMCRVQQIVSHTCWNLELAAQLAAGAWRAYRSSAIALVKKPSARTNGNSRERENLPCICVAGTVGRRRQPLPAFWRVHCRDACHAAEPERSAATTLSGFFVKMLTWRIWFDITNANIQFVYGYGSDLYLI
jgi:hypothetical protein